MAVAFDAKMTAGNGGTGGDTMQASATTTVSGTPITVGASATLLVVLANWGVTQISAPTATWNGVSMTLRAGPVGPSVVSAIFVLPNPASGAKTLALSWTTSSDAYIGAVSFTGTDTVTGIKTTDTVTGTSGTTVTINTAASDATVATWIANGGTPTTNFNLVWDDSVLNPGGAGTYQLGGSGTNGHTFTGGGATVCWAGVHVLAAAAAGVIAGWPIPTAGPSLAI